MDAGTASSVVAVGALALLPLVFITTTSFLKISVVFSILRNALGAGDVPSGLLVTALAAILSLYVMAPVGERMMAAAAPVATEIDPAAPLAQPDLLWQASVAAFEPLRAFLERNAARREVRFFAELAREGRPDDQRASITEADALVVIPAFVVTELAEAFQIGFLVFVPFLVIDLVIASLLASLGMTALSPATVSLPFKLLLFVAVDGWYLLARALVLGYV